MFFMQTQMEDMSDDEIFANFLETQMEEDMSDDEFFGKLPPGYRFQPTDEELLYYLALKINNEPLPRNRIRAINLYQFNPENLAERFKAIGENEWYFFTPRDKKCKNGSRPNRAAGDGSWKPCSCDISIKHNGKEEIGCKKLLIYYKGKHPGMRTDWIMNEFRLKNAPPPVQTAQNSMRLDDWVLCKLYKKIKRTKPTKEETRRKKSKFQMRIQITQT